LPRDAGPVTVTGEELPDALTVAPPSEEVHVTAYVGVSPPRFPEAVKETEKEASEAFAVATTLEGSDGVGARSNVITMPPA